MVEKRAVGVMLVARTWLGMVSFCVVVVLARAEDL